MHGRPRETREATAEEKAEKAEKIAKYNRLKNAVLAKHVAKQYDEEGYALAGKMAEINPDFYTLWNFRRNAVETFFAAKPEQKAELCEAELRLTERGFQRNPKAYGAWHHRTWVITQGTTDLVHELRLCTKMLGLDARNFHCWNHRRWVAARAYAECPGVVTPETELAFATEKINENFSNYSAWHYRTVLLPMIVKQHKDKNPGADLTQWYNDLLDKEFALVKDAFYTEPEDQSAWLYHRWLLGRVVEAGPAVDNLVLSLGQPFRDEDPAPSAPVAAPEITRLRQIQVFERELGVCSELMEVEDKCKWVILTTALLQGGLEALRQAQAAKRDGDTITSIRGLFARLLELDPMRSQYYHDVREGLLKDIEQK